MAKIQLDYEASRRLKDRSAAVIGRAVADTEFRRIVLAEPQTAFRLMGIEISDAEADQLRARADQLSVALAKADSLLFEAGADIAVGGIKIPPGEVAANCGCGGAGVVTDIYESEWLR